jgi:TolB-like protein
MEELGTLPGGVSADQVLAQLARILASDLFVHSHRLSRFLRFTVEHVLEGKSALLKEQVIGVHVFDRPPTFDPRLDAIVRVEARRLRSKLEQFYAESGRDDAIVIEFRKGRYIPIIALRQATREAFTSRTVAVLPFEPADLFAAGVLRDVTAALTKAPGVRVLAEASVVAYAGAPLTRVLNELGATMAVRGSIDRTSDEVILSLEILEGARGARRQEKFETAGAGAAELQGRVARSIVARIVADGDLELRKAEVCLARMTAEGLREALAYLDGAPPVEGLDQTRTIAMASAAIFAPGSRADAEAPADWLSLFRNSDPVLPPALLVGVLDAYSARRAGEAKELAREALRLYPNCPPLVWASALCQTGERPSPELVAAVEQAAVRAGHAPYMIAMAGVLAARSGESARATQTLNDLPAGCWFERAMIHAVLGEFQNVVTALARGSDSPWMPAAAQWPLFSVGTVVAQGQAV